MNKTTTRFNWQHGHTRRRVLSRSFPTKEQAEQFAAGKQVIDIYIIKGNRYKVEWIKESIID